VPASPPAGLDEQGADLAPHQRVVLAGGQHGRRAEADGVRTLVGQQHVPPPALDGLGPRRPRLRRAELRDRLLRDERGVRHGPGVGLDAGDLGDVGRGGGTDGGDGHAPCLPDPARQALVRHGNVSGMDNRRAAWAALGVVYVLWGSTYLANRFIIVDVPPLLAGGLRFLVGGTLLGAVVAAVAGWRAFGMTRAQFGTTALSGLLLPAWGNGIVTLGQQQVSSGLAALLIAAVPLYIVVLRAITGDRPGGRTVSGVAVGAVGLALLLLTGTSGSGGTEGNAWWGPLLILLAGLGWATGTFATTRLPVPANPFALAAVQMLVGGAILLAVSLSTGDRLDVAAVSPSAWWAWAYMAVVVSLGAFSAYAYALASLPVSTVATYAYVNPVIAVLLGVLVAGESFSAVQILGGGIVLGAVALVLAAGRRERRTSVAASVP
jgi:drug/metabolite transporter (DMT)-like permease